MRELKWPARGGRKRGERGEREGERGEREGHGAPPTLFPSSSALGLEFDLIPIPDAVKYYGLPAAAADRVAGVVAAAAAAAAPNPAPFPRPGDRAILVTGVEPGAPTAASTPLRPGDVVLEVAGRVVAGDLRALERALHTRANATVPLTVYRFGQRLQVDAPVYDMTADRVQR